jgi:hypothetical protein
MYPAVQQIFVSSMSRPFVKEANIDTASKVFHQLLPTNLLRKILSAKLQGLAY